MKLLLLLICFSSSSSFAFLPNGNFWTAAGQVKVSNISPDSGTAAGGGSVAILGLGFKSGATASIGGVNCTTTTYVSPTQVTCVVPASAVYGLRDVVVTNSDASTGTLPKGFGYVGSPILWLKADALALADGAGVSTWTDSSGSGYNATTATGGNPIFHTGAVNSKPSVTFSGAEYMNTTLASSSILKNTMFAVMNTSTAAVAVGPTVCCSPAFILSFGMFGATGIGSSVKNNLNGQSTAGNTASDYGKYFIAGARFNSAYPASDTGTAIDAYSNDSHFTGSMSGTIGVDPTYVEIGSRYSGSNNFVGNISEVLIYSSALSDANLQAIQCYLAHKYGLAVPGC